MRSNREKRREEMGSTSQRKKKKKKREVAKKSLDFSSLAATRAAACCCAVDFPISLFRPARSSPSLLFLFLPRHKHGLKGSYGYAVQRHRNRVFFQVESVECWNSTSSLPSPSPHQPLLSFVQLSQKNQPTHRRPLRRSCHGGPLQRRRPLCRAPRDPPAAAAAEERRRRRRQVIIALVFFCLYFRALG